MANYIMLENKGEITTGALTLIGASTKRDDESAIGFFGSGNKYAIAVLLRNKVPFMIFSGETKVTITTKPVTFNDKVFNQILINRQRTSLTTDMGPDWEVWFAVREFIANAIDEKDYAVQLDAAIAYGVKGKTRIFIEKTAEIQNFVDNFSNYFTFYTQPLQQINNIARYNGDGTMNIFRKCISVTKRDENRKALWWYNIDNIDINESRVFAYEFQIREALPQILAQMTDKQDIAKLLNAYHNNIDCIEEDAAWLCPKDCNFSNEWHEMLIDKVVYPRTVAQFFDAYEDRRNGVIVPDNLARFIHDKMPDINVRGMSTAGYALLNNISTGQLARFEALHDELVDIGCIKDCFSKVRFVKFISNSTIAMYDSENDIICISEKFFNYDDFAVQSMFVEEYLHSCDYDDGSREIVEYLIKLYIEAKTELCKAQS